MEKLPKIIGNPFIFSHKNQQKVIKTDLSNLKFEYVDPDVRKQVLEDEEAMKKLNDSEYEVYPDDKSKVEEEPIDFNNHIINEINESNNHIESLLPKSVEPTSKKNTDGVLIKNHMIKYTDIPDNKKTLSRKEYSVIRESEDLKLGYGMDQNLIQGLK